jgi:hypothetical protein
MCYPLLFFIFIIYSIIDLLQWQVTCRILGCCLEPNHYCDGKKIKRIFFAKILFFNLFFIKKTPKNLHKPPTNHKPPPNPKTQNHSRKQKSTK